MERRTIYISGAITHDPDYMEHFKKGEADIYDNVSSGDWHFTSVINPAKVNANLPTDFSHEDYMHVCFSMLDKCAAIYMLTGWQHSKGANMEKVYAQNLGLEIYYEEEG